MTYFFFCFQAVAELAVVIYTALDFGLNDGEERNLSPGLENLLDLMTSIGEENVTIFTEVTLNIDKAKYGSNLRGYCLIVTHTSPVMYLFKKKFTP